jgi:NAD+-dependent secondary alcohol dehydrogenase Adh1
MKAARLHDYHERLALDCFVGNLVGTYNDLAELMTLQAQGTVELHTTTNRLDAMADLDGGRLQGRGILVPG